MAKDLVNSAADGLLKETLAILKGKGTDADKVANALDHLSLGLQARKLAAKRMAAKPAVAKTTAPAADIKVSADAKPNGDAKVSPATLPKPEPAKSGMFR